MTTDDLDVRIQTPRLLLAQFRQDDFDHHYRWLNSEPVARVLPIPGPVPKEVAQAILDQVLALPLDQGIQLAIWTREPRRLIGGIGLAGRDLRDQHAGVSALIGEADQWGQGYITEAAAALIGYAFEQLKLRKLWLNHHDFNRAARRVADKLGFVEVGRQRDHCFVADEWTDWVTMELFAPQ